MSFTQPRACIKHRDLHWFITAFAAKDRATIPRGVLGDGVWDAMIFVLTELVLHSKKENLEATLSSLSTTYKSLVILHHTYQYTYNKSVLYGTQEAGVSKRLMVICTYWTGWLG